MSQNSAKRILIVDHDPMDAARERVILNKQGFDVLNAGTAEAAYDMAIRQPLNMAVITIELPDMDGYTLCQRLRQNPATHTLPILLMGARGRPEDKIAAFESGADDYLTIPFQNEELVYRVKGLIARAPLQAATKSASSHGQGQTVAVFSSKGGVGKTTVAVNVATPSSGTCSEDGDTRTWRVTWPSRCSSSTITAFASVPTRPR